MSVRPSDDVETDLIALSLSGWGWGPLNELFHEDVEDHILRTRETYARCHMTVDQALRADLDRAAAERGLDRAKLEAARGALSRFRFGLLSSDLDHPDSFCGYDRFDLPLSNRDLAEIYYGEVPDGS